LPERLSEGFVRKIRIPARGNRITYDAEVKGFGVRVTAGGAKAFVLNYRVGGRERRYTIGSWPDWTVAAARGEAKHLKCRIDLGEDPMADRNAERGTPTVAELVAAYREEQLPSKRPSSRRDYEGILDRHVLPKLGRRRVQDVRTEEVEELHRQVKKKTPYRANRVLAICSVLFNVAVRKGWRADNPCKGIRKAPEQPRSRYLTAAELRRLTAVLDKLPNQEVANVVRLLLLTGARRGEVLGARWSDFDLEAGVWTKPSAHTKQRRVHRVPLSGTCSPVGSRTNPGSTSGTGGRGSATRRESPTSGSTISVTPTPPCWRARAWASR
jgi:hypothetical protein